MGTTRRVASERGYLQEDITSRRCSIQCRRQWFEGWPTKQERNESNKARPIVLERKTSADKGWMCSDFLHMSLIVHSKTDSSAVIFWQEEEQNSVTEAIHTLFCSRGI
mmetsp:Transcript_40346/g.97430  ORF Transcript_40346/g.97430 Transcript_40346/m.97430 type:complete len:108 (+) Transcript_40346:107-430(+)